MGIGTIILTVIVFLISLAAFIAGGFHLCEKGPLLNNEYLYASAKQRAEMDKKPLYRQSGIVFLLAGVIFLINGIELIVKTGWLFYAVLVLGLVAIVYAFLSSAKSTKK